MIFHYVGNTIFIDIKFTQKQLNLLAGMDKKRFISFSLLKLVEHTTFNEQWTCLL